MSLESLLENLDNVTIRNKLLKKSKSTESVNVSEIESLCSEINMRSLDLSTGMHAEYIEDLKNEIKELKLQLEVTRNELDNVILENNELKRTVCRQEQQMDILRNICASPSKLQNKQKQLTRKSQRHSLVDNLRLSIGETSVSSENNNNNITPMVEKTEHNPNKKVISEDTVNDNIYENNDEKTQTDTKFCKGKMLQNKLPCISTPNKKTEFSGQKTVYIFGGRQCKHLALNLMKSRIASQYEKYKFISFIKPQATAEEIIRTSNIYEYTENDRIIICVGEQDNNPMKIMIELSSFLTTICCPVFVLSVRDNKFLNESKLNNMLRLICKNFKNCRFVDLNYVPQCNNFHRNVFDMCKSINLELDQFEYHNQFLSFNNRILNKTNKSDLHSIPKKGTIPYYFPVQKKIKNSQFFRCKQDK